MYTAAARSRTKCFSMWVLHRYAGRIIFGLYSDRAPPDVRELYATTADGVKLKDPASKAKIPPTKTRATRAL